MPKRPTIFSTTTFALTFSFLLLACADVKTNKAEQTIIGGTVNPGDEAVVYLDLGGGSCTGSVITETVILTAAHCIIDNIREGRKRATVHFGPGHGDFWASRPVIDMYMQRAYNERINHNDIALLRLGEKIPESVTPLPVNIDPIDDDFEGALIRLVGYGFSERDPSTGEFSGSGIKRQMETTITSVASEAIYYGDMFHNVCMGDSGGPAFISYGDVEKIVGVTSIVNSDCMGGSGSNRFDLYTDEFFRVIDAWTAPCHLNGECVTNGCRTPDPDCALCGVDGICSEGCAVKD